MRARPFLFSKNPVAPEWTPVVVPSSVTDREARSILLEAQKGDLIEDGSAILIKANHSVLGVMDLLFRQDARVFRDKRGRRFQPYEGIMLSERRKGYVFCKEHLDVARELLRPQFEKFWTEEKWSSEQAKSAAAFNLEDVEANTPLKISYRNMRIGNDVLSAQERKTRTYRDGFAASDERRKNSQLKVFAERLGDFVFGPRESDERKD